MTTNPLTPGETIHIKGLKDPYTYIGPSPIGSFEGEDVAVYEDASGFLYKTPLSYVVRGLPPIDIPEGYGLINTHDLIVGRHVVYDPDSPEHPWENTAVRTLANGPEALVVARLNTEDDR